MIFIAAALSTCQRTYTKILDCPQRLFGDPYLLTRLLWDPIWGFAITANLIFRRLGLKMPVHAAKEEFSRICPLDGEQYQRHPHRRTHEWFCIEWRINRLNILHRSGVMFFSTKIQDVGCCHLNLCYARKFWCRMTSYAYTSYLAQIFLTVPEIVGCHSHSIYAKILHHPRKLSGDSYLVNKFRTDPIFRFEINGKFNFSPVWLENAYSHPKCVWGIWPQSGVQYQRGPKSTSLRDSASFEPSNAKIRWRVWPVVEFRKGV